MSGVVVVAGVFEPGSVVKLYAVADERVLRPEGDELVGTALVDENGNIGWSDLEIDGRYFAEGYVNGQYVIVRCRATDAEAAADLIQQPVQPEPQKIGTQEDPPVVEPPAPPANADELPTGLPDGVQSPILAQRPLFIHKGDGEIDTENFSLTGQQTAAVEGSDGSTVEPEALYRYTGPGEPDADSWEAYEGATEDAPAPVETPIGGTAPEAAQEESSAAGETTVEGATSTEPKTAGGDVSQESTVGAPSDSSTSVPDAPAVTADGSPAEAQGAGVDPAAPDAPAPDSPPDVPAEGVPATAPEAQPSDAAPDAPAPDSPPASPEAGASGADQVAP